MQEMTRNCRSPLLKRVLNTDFFSHFPAYFFLFSLANLHNKNAGYPIGGSLPITIYNFDSTLADEGETCVRGILRTHNFHYWHDLRENDSLVYEREKERVAQSLIEILDKQMGNIIPYVEVVDVATPATFYRYTNNWI